MTIIIALAVAALPQIVRAITEAAEKKNADDAKRRAAQGLPPNQPQSQVTLGPSQSRPSGGPFTTSGRPGQVPGPGQQRMLMSEAERRAELAARRQAEIEAWRARRQRAETGRQVIGRPGGDLARQRREALDELRKQQQQRVPSQPPQQRPTADHNDQVAQAWRRAQQEEAARRQREATPDRHATRRQRPAPATAQPPRIIVPAQAAPISAQAAPIKSPSRRSRNGAVIPGSRFGPAAAPLILSPANLRQAIILKEILDPPLALREMGH